MVRLRLQQNLALYGDTHLEMATEHRALIHWSATQVRRGLPEKAQLIDPAWFDSEPPNVDEGWSLVCQFDSPPASQGSPSAAHVHFIMEAAPHDRLRREYRSDYLSAARPSTRG